MKISELQKTSHEMCLSKGWWPYPTGASGKLRLEPDTIAAKLALVHSEISEALEEVRDGHLDTYWVHRGTVCEQGQQIPAGAKPEGLPVELADVVLRVTDLAGALQIDLESAIKDKIAYNDTRAHRHGGRTL